MAAFTLNYHGGLNLISFIFHANVFSLISLILLWLPSGVSILVNFVDSIMFKYYIVALEINCNVFSFKIKKLFFFEKKCQLQWPFIKHPVRDATKGLNIPREYQGNIPRNVNLINLWGYIAIYHTSRDGVLTNQRTLFSIEM